MSVRNAVKSIQDIMWKDAGVDGDAQRLSQLCWMFFLKIIDDQDQELEALKPGYRSPIPMPLRWRTWAANPEGITGDQLLEFVNGDLFPRLKELSSSGKSGERRRIVRDVFEDAYNYMKSGHLMRQVINKINQIDFNDLSERQHFGEIYEQLLNDLQGAGNAGEFYTPRGVTAFMVDRINPKPGELLFDPACGTGGFLTCAIRYMRDRYVKRPEDEVKMQAALRAVEKKQLPHMLCVTNMLLHGIEDASFVRHDNSLARPYISYTQSDRVDIILTNPPFGGREEDGIETNFPKHFQTRETADLFLALILRLLKKQGRAAIVLPDGSLFGDGVKTRIKEQLMDECNLHTIVRLPNSVFKPYASIGANLLFFEKGEPTKDIWFYEHRVPEGQKAYSMTRPIRFEHLQDCIDWWGGAKRTGRTQTAVAWKVTLDEIKARDYNLDIKNPHSVAINYDDPQEIRTALETTNANVNALREELKATLSEALALNAKPLLQHFAAIENAPDVISRLRRFILDLAVRGKLVPQCSTEEPAPKLLERIASKKTQLIEVGELKKEKPLPQIKPEEIPFDLPVGWVWERLGNVGETNIGLTYSPQDISKTGVPVLRSGNVKNGKLDLSELVRVKNKPKTSVIVREEDLLICARNGSRSLVGKVAVIEGLKEPTAFGAFMAIFRSDLNRYLYYFIRSPLFRQVIDEVNTTTINQITQHNLRSTVAPIPPFEEQRRIVSKVNELMALCDRWESEIAVSRDNTTRLLEAILQEALPPTPACRLEAAQ